MAEAHDSWLGVLGVDVDQIRNKVQSVVGDVATKVEQGIDSVVQGATQLYKDAENAVTQTVQTVENAGGVVAAVKKGVDVAKTKALGDQSGKPVPRPLEADCKPEHGYVPGPKNHLLCATHGHVIDTDQGKIIAESVAAYLKQGLASVVDKAGADVSQALAAGNTAGKAVMSAESAAWDGAKSTYNAVTGAYDSVAPNFTKSNQNLGQLVDAGEAAAKKANDQAAAQYADVPVLGSLVKASASLSNAMTEAAGGVVKGVGDLATMGGNAIVHPIDAAVSLGEGALGIAEHVPIAPGLNTTVKGVHGLVDLARGKKDGEYGGSLADLGENLLLDTKQDRNDPSKRTNADIDFAAGMGGGTKTWTEKPVEAATHTITDLVPMILGDEGGTKPVPEDGPPVPEDGPPAPKTVDPGKTQPNANTLDLGKTQPNAPAQGPQTEVDPPNPQPDPDAPKANPEEALKQAQQDLADAEAAQKAAQNASFKATQEYVRYRANKPNPGRGVEGDPSKWDPTVDEALRDQMLRAEQASIEAINNLNAAERAARDAAGRARGARGRGGLT
jgi:ElaB/YqjD/DUF883 family membrane-anchored ribosome-binding protein